ncbi:MAG: hypothetical protein DWQ04_20675 [Chloroflexi bacterium]|nr:MAG: hypothetical protein DWQ04_20675 [Chloroflexota bacterium]
MWGAGAFLRKEEENELSLIDGYSKDFWGLSKWDDVARTEVTVVFRCAALLKCDAPSWLSSINL